MLGGFMLRKKVSLREMLSLVGYLSFCCTVVTPGRAFLRRLIDKTKGVRQLHHRLRIDKECRLDLGMWQVFLRYYNGRSFFLREVWESNTALHLFTDAAKKLGFGALFKSHWFFGAWPPLWTQYNIVILELFPIVLALETWGGQLANKRLMVHTDNEALVAILNKQSSSDKLTMVLVRRLVLALFKCNIHMRAVHIAGIKNDLADSLSRLQVEKFLALAGKAGHAVDCRPTRIAQLPPSLI